MVSIGVTHISCHYKNTIEGTEEKKNKRTKRTIMLGVTQEQKESYATFCIPDSIYGLTLAWITSEKSTKQLECRHLDSIFFAVLDPLSCWLASLLSCPVANCQLRAPFFNSLLASRYHFRTRREFKSKNPLSGFAPKQTKESSAWRATYIVLQIALMTSRDKMLVNWIIVFVLVIFSFQEISATYYDLE